MLVFCHKVKHQGIFCHSVSEDPGGSYVTPKEERFGIDHSGDVLWWPGKVLKTQCEIDITFFPFDYQQCSLLIGPWSYQSFQVSSNSILPHLLVNELELIRGGRVEVVFPWQSCTDPMGK